MVTLNFCIVLRLLLNSLVPGDLLGAASAVFLPRRFQYHNLSKFTKDKTTSVPHMSFSIL
jgi:hypothetical protein